MLLTPLHYQLVDDIYAAKRRGLRLRQKIMLTVGLIFVLSKAYAWLAP